MNFNFLKKEYGIKDSAINLLIKAEEDVKDRFSKIDEIAAQKAGIIKEKILEEIITPAATE